MGKNTSKNKGGRPLQEIDINQLDELISIQCTGEECASVLGVSYDTLQRMLQREFGIGFAEYFKEKSGKGRASLRRRQWMAAQEGNATMLVWLGKQWLGQTDKNDISHTGKDGGPIETAHKIDLENLTDEQLEAYRILSTATTRD